MKSELKLIPDEEESPAGSGTFAVPFRQQFAECFKRVWQQYWRTPTYIMAKLILSGVTALFIGFSFYKAKNSQQGLQNQMFSVFMFFTVFNNLVQQIHPQFVAQRALYEARERPSKAYSWQAFMLAQIVVEIPWQILTAIITFFGFYYPIGLYKNAIPTDAVTERGGLFFLYMLVFFIFTSTFAHMTIAGTETAEAGSNMSGLMFEMCLLFCGVLATGSNLGWCVVSIYTSVCARLTGYDQVDLDELPQPIHLSSFRYALDRCRQYSCNMLRHRVFGGAAAGRADLLPVPRRIRHCCSIDPEQPRRDKGLPNLPAIDDKPVSNADRGELFP